MHIFIFQEAGGELIIYHRQAYFPHSTPAEVLDSHPHRCRDLLTPTPYVFRNQGDNTGAAGSGRRVVATALTQHSHP